MFSTVSAEELLTASAPHIFHFTYITSNHLVRSLPVTNTAVWPRTGVATCRADSKPTEILFSRTDAKRENLVLDAVVSQMSLWLQIELSLRLPRCGLTAQKFSCLADDLSSFSSFLAPCPG